MAFEHYNESDQIQLLNTEIENWSENLLVLGCDEKAGISFYSHLGRMPYDPLIWEGVAYILLPGGECLVHRSMGKSAAHARINQEYSYTPVVPGQIWTFHFDGLAQRATSQELSQRPIYSEKYEPLSFDLVFNGIHPTHDFHDSLKDQAWAKMHLEQAGEITGIISFGGKNYPIDCIGYRDHSAGPRSYVSLKQEAWALAHFPSGRVFSALYVEASGHPPLKSGYIYDSGEIKSIELTDFPRLSNSRGGPDNFSVKAVCGGSALSLTGAMLGPFITATLPNPSGILAGFKADAGELNAVVMAPATYEWDGETGIGWIERIRRIDELSG